jgi:hypothetical protein
VPLLVKITLQYWRLLFSESTELPFSYGFPHFSEKLKEKMNIMDSV